MLNELETIYDIEWGRSSSTNNDHSRPSHTAIFDGSGGYAT